MVSRIQVLGTTVLYYGGSEIGDVGAVAAVQSRAFL
jgi:hypothetical protein